MANQKNEGIAVNYFRGAELGRGEYYWIVHGDNAMWVSEGKKVIDLLGKADIIIPENGTRLFSAKHNFDHRSFGRRIISRLFAILVRLASGIRLWYFNGLILTKRERVLENRVGTYGFGYMAEILCKALSDPEVNYLEVRVHNYDRAALPTSAFKTKNVLSVIASLWRILIGRCKGM